MGSGAARTVRIWALNRGSWFQAPCDMSAHLCDMYQLYHYSVVIASAFWCLCLDLTVNRELRCLLRRYMWLYLVVPADAPSISSGRSRQERAPGMSEVRSEDFKLVRQIGLTKHALSDNDVLSHDRVGTALSRCSRYLTRGELSLVDKRAGTPYSDGSRCSATQTPTAL